MTNLSILWEGLSSVFTSKGNAVTSVSLKSVLMGVLIAGLSSRAFCLPRAGDETVIFDIPPASAEKSLTLFARQANVQLLYPHDLAKELETPGLHGPHTVLSGIELLIKHSCLAVESYDNNNLILRVKNPRGFWFMKRNDCRKQSLVLAVTGALLGGAASDGLAQQAQSLMLELEEVVVTAQKKSESIQEVPVAISAFDFEELNSRGVTNTDDLGIVVPGLEMARQAAAATTFIRGIGSSAAGTGNEANVSTYIDGVYVASQEIAVSAFNNIERIEVLKGPQGTLFGRNTTGGLIHIITKDPTYEKQLQVGGSVENFGAYTGSLYGSTALAETVAADVALSFRKQNDGYGTNRVDGKDVGYSEYSMVRSKLLWEPSEVTSIQLRASWGETEGNIAAVASCLGPFPCFGGEVPQSDYHDVSYNIVPEVETDRKDFSLKVLHSLGDYEFMSLSSYHDSTSLQIIDLDGSRVPRLDLLLSAETETFSQEFQLQSTDDSKPYSWILGVFYWDNTAKRDPTMLSNGLSSFATLDTKSYAGFAQGTYEITEDTSLTLGARWTKDERELSGNNFFGSAPTPVASFGADKSFDELTGRLSLDHRITDDIMVYGSYNRGFKSGNFNSTVLSGVIQDPVEPEIIDAYEMGMKGDFFNNRFRLNVSLFYYDYTNLQLTRILPEGTGVILENAGEAEVYGFEAEGQAIITEGLSLNYGLSVLNSEYTEFPSCVVWTPLVGGSARSAGDCGGNDLIRSPDYTYNIGLRYFIPYDSGSFTFNTILAYNDGFFWDSENRVSEGSYSLLNANITWATPDDRLRVSLYGKNLLDEEYSIYTLEGGGGFGDRYAAGPPLTFGLSFSWSVF